MAPNVPYLPLNPLRPRAFGGKGAEGLKKQIPSSNKEKRETQIPAQLLFQDAIRRAGLPYDLLVNITENSQGAGFSEFMNKIYEDGAPGALYRMDNQQSGGSQLNNSFDDLSFTNQGINTDTSSFNGAPVEGFGPGTVVELVQPNET